MDFGVGHPRSGTHLLNDLLNAGGAAWSEHEGLVNRSPDLALIEIATEYYEGRIGADRVKQVLAACPVWRMNPIDASWKNTWILPVLLAAHPRARFLHLARDPRRNVIACHNLDYYGHAVTSQEHEDYARWKRAMPAIRRPDWESLSVFERNCAFWVETHRLILDTLSSRTERYTLIRLEDLRDPASAARVFRFFELPVPPEEQLRRVLSTPSNAKTSLKGQIAETKGDLLPSFEECPAELQDALRRICGPIAAQLGYDLEASTATRAQAPSHDGTSARDLHPIPQAPAELEAPVEALRRTQTEILEARREVVAARTQFDGMRAQIDDLRARAEAMERSLSWRVTSPLRWGTRIAVRMMQRATWLSRRRDG
jgi:hypothetical protein